MSDYTYDTVMSESMLHEFYMLKKQAGVSARWGNVIGAGLGALGGGLYGRSTAPEGAETGGAIGGALKGAVVGALGGQFATKAGQGEALRFGQRQLHGMTGYLPGRGILGTKGQALAPTDRLKALEGIGFDFQHGSKKQIQKRMAEGVAKGKITKYLPQNVQNFMASRQASSALANRQLAEEGMTSIPGLARGYTRGGASGKVTPWQATKMNLTAPGLAMGVGIPGLMSYQAVKEYRETGDKRRLASNLAGNAGFALGGALPMTAMMGLGAAGGAAGNLIGRGVEAISPSHAPAVPPGSAGQVVPR